MTSLLRKVTWWVQRRRKEDELREELQFHLEEEADERQAGGVPEEQATRAARRDLGNVTLLREDTRVLWTWTLLEQFAQDVRFALRTMVRNRAFTALAALSLALGIGANTAIYSFMDSILLRSLPVSDPASLIVMNWRSGPFNFGSRAAANGSDFVMHSIDGHVYDDASGATAGIFPFPAFERLQQVSAPVLSSAFAYVPAGRKSGGSTGMSTRVGGAVLALCVSSCAAAGQQPPGQVRVQIEPYDNACDLPELCSFRAQLVKLVDARNAAGVVPLLSRTFNDGSSQDSADLSNELTDPRSPVWAELRHLLNLGGSLSIGRAPEFCAPYGYTRYPREGSARLLSVFRSDGYAAVVTVPRAPIHSKPDPKSSVIGYVGHELIAESGGGDWSWNRPNAADAWMEVYWRQVVGYIQRRNLWSPNDPHLCMVLENGRWMIKEFRDADGRVD